MTSSSFYTLPLKLLHKVDAENAHTLTIRALKTGLVPMPERHDDPALKVNLWNRTFPNPLGLAAGFDKNAEIIAAMLRTGFGFVEAGTVTPQPQSGNPRPRVFREAAHGAVINRMGFPGQGAAAFKRNIEKFFETKPRPPGVIGINIGMNKGAEDPAKDYRALVRSLGSYADYLTVNISSPNTPGLRNLQARENLLPLLAAILDERAKSCAAGDLPPVLVKLAPDLDAGQLEDVAAALMESGIDGVILGNTTLERPDYLSPAFRTETGGLSGRPLTAKSTDIIRRFHRLSGGRLPIIGAGGVATAKDAYDKIKAGASLVQLYTALVYHGPSLPGTILSGLSALLKKDGFRHIGDAVGRDA